MMNQHPTISRALWQSQLELGTVDPPPWITPPPGAGGGHFKNINIHTLKILKM